MNFKILKGERKKPRPFGKLVSEERACNIWTNVEMMIANKKNILTEKASKFPDLKFIARCKELIENCAQTLRGCMEEIGASEAEISKMLALVNNDEIEAAQEHLLNVLCKRNPGLYGHKSAAYQIKSNQR